MQEETFILSSLNRINISGCKNSCTHSQEDVYGKHVCYIKVLFWKWISHFIPIVLSFKSHFYDLFISHLSLWTLKKHPCVLLMLNSTQKSIQIYFYKITCNCDLDYRHELMIFTLNLPPSLKQHAVNYEFSHYHHLRPAIPVCST